MTDPSIRTEIVAMILATGAANMTPLAPLNPKELIHAETLADALMAHHDFQRRGPDTPLSSYHDDRNGIIATVLATRFTKSARRSTRKGVDHGAESDERSRRAGLLADKILRRFALPVRERRLGHKTPAGFNRS